MADDWRQRAIERRELAKREGLSAAGAADMSPAERLTFLRTGVLPLSPDEAANMCPQEQRAYHAAARGIAQ